MFTLPEFKNNISIIVTFFLNFIKPRIINNYKFWKHCFWKGHFYIHKERKIAEPERWGLGFRDLIIKTSTCTNCNKKLDYDNN